jgi:hypothetical protein
MGKKSKAAADTKKAKPAAAPAADDDVSLGW